MSIKLMHLLTQWAYTNMEDVLLKKAIDLNENETDGKLIQFPTVSNGNSKIIEEPEMDKIIIQVPKGSTVKFQIVKNEENTSISNLVPLKEIKNNERIVKNGYAEEAFTSDYDIIDSDVTINNIEKTKLGILIQWYNDAKKELQCSLEKNNKLEQQLYLFKEQKELILKELFVDYKTSVGELDTDLVAQGIEYIKKERNDMKNVRIKLDYPIPNVTIVFIIISSIMLSFFLMSFVLTVFNNIYIMHPFYSFSSAIGALGILITSIASIKDWRGFIKNVK